MKQFDLKKVVIIGGGFAGVALAKSLEKKLPSNWDIFLLSKTNFFTYTPLLPEVVGASVLPAHVEAPLRLILKRTRIRMVTVDRIDFANKTVHYHNDETASLPFDQLVFANGLGASMKMLPGLSENALPLKTVGDALYIRNTILERLEQATIHSNPERRKLLTKFLVVGGGFSGVEVAGEINDFLKSAERYYKNVKCEDCLVSILQDSDRLLPEMSAKLSNKTKDNFVKRGIGVYLNACAVNIGKEKVVLDSGEVLQAATIICTIGTQPHRFCQSPELPLHKGRIVAQSDMSVAGIEGIWALGDCALVPNQYDNRLCPPTAQFANRQGKFLAENINRKLRGNETRPFSYKPVGMLSSIGRNNAVAEFYGFRISGLMAFLLRRAIYLLKVPSLSRKVRLYLEWSWAMLFPPDIAHLGFERSEED